MPLSNRIREYRQQRGLTLRDLSQHIGIDFGQLSKIERDAVGTSDERKLRLARFFDVSITELFFQPSVEMDSPEHEAEAMSA